MKKLIALIAILSLFFSFALSEIKNIKIDGSLETLSINLDNSTDLKKTNKDTGTNDDLVNQTKSRLMLSLSANLTEKVAGKILVYKNNRLWGTLEENVNGVLGTLNIANAYVTVEDVVLDGLKLTVGRQFIGNPKDLLLYYGPLSDYKLNVSALDALKVEYVAKLFSVGLVTGKIIETTPWTPPGNKDTDIIALIGETDKLIPRGLVSLMYVNMIRNSPIKDNVDSIQVLGLNLKSSILVIEGLITYKLLYAMNMGQKQKDVNYKGTGLVLGVGYENDLEVGKINIKLEYASGSGDDLSTKDNEDFVSFGNDYRYGEIYGKGLNLGISNVGGAGIKNQTIVALEVDFVPSAILDGKLSLGLGRYLFDFTKVSSGQEKNLGNETDVKVKYSLTDNVGLGLTYGIFIPGPALESKGEDAANVLAMNLSVKF